MSIHRSWMSCRGTGLRWCNFSRPCQVVLIRFAASSTARCWDADCRAIDSEPHSSPERLPVALVQPVEQLAAGRVGQRLEHQAQVVGHGINHAGICLHVKRRLRSRAVSGVRTTGGRRRRPPVLARARAARAGRRARALPARRGCRPRSGSTSPRPSATTARPWPIAYALPDDERLAVLERLGVRAFPTLPYPHKPGMAAWLNDWSARVRRERTRRCCSRRRSSPSRRRRPTSPRRSTRGARVFKVHVQVGGFDPRDPLLDAGLGAAGGDRHAGRHPLRVRAAGRRSTPAPEPVTGLLERHPRLQLVIAHLGMPEYRRLPRAGRALRAGAPGHHDVRHRLHRAADALRPRRPAAAGRAAGQGAARQRLPVDPVPLRPPARRRCTGWSWGRTGCAPSCGTTAPGCSGSRRDPELPPDRRRPRHARPARAWPASTSGCSAGRSATTSPTGRRCGRPTAAPGCPSSWRPTTCRRCGRRSRATQQMQMHLDLQVDDLAAACAVAEEAGARLARRLRATRDERARLRRPRRPPVLPVRAPVNPVARSAPRLA